MQIGPYRKNIPCKQPTKGPPNVAQGPEMIRIDLQNVKVTTVTVHTGESSLPMAVLFYVGKYNYDILVGLILLMTLGHIILIQLLGHFMISKFPLHAGYLLQRLIKRNFRGHFVFLTDPWRWYFFLLGASYILHTSVARGVGWGGGEETATP